MVTPTAHRSSGKVVNTFCWEAPADMADVYANLSERKFLGTGVVRGRSAWASNAGKMSRPSTQSPQPLHPCPRTFYTPQNFWTAYDCCEHPYGRSTTIAIFAEGDLTQVIKDFAP